MCSSNGNKTNTKPRYRQAITVTQITMRLIMPAMLTHSQLGPQSDQKSLQVGAIYAEVIAYVGDSNPLRIRVFV